MLKNYFLIMLLFYPIPSLSDVRLSDYEDSEEIKLNYSSETGDKWLDKTLKAKTINENQELVSDRDCLIRQYSRSDGYIEKMDNICLSLKLAAKERQRLEAQNSYKNIIWSILSLPLGLRVLK